MARPFSHFQTGVRPVQMMYDWVPRTNAVRLSGAVEDILGRGGKADCVDLAHWTDLIHPEDRPAFSAEINRVLEDSSPFQLRYRVRKSDESYLAVEDVGQFVRDAEGRIERMVGFISAIDQRLRDETDVERLADFARLNPNPILELSADAEINFANDAAAQMSQALGQLSLHGILPSNTGEILAACLHTGLPTLRTEVEIGNRILSWSFFPIPGRAIVHCYGGDISDRKRLETQFRQAQKMESLGRLSAGIAHDFNNLLTVVQAHAGLVQDSPLLPGELGPAVAGIMSAADRGSHLTRQLLTFSRKQRMEMQVVDLRPLVAEMSQLLGRTLGEHITIEFSLAEAPQCVRADLGMMEQIVMNLAVNARDAMPRSGRLRISLETVERVDAATQAVETCVKWTFADTGGGIPREVLPHIFDPFFTTKGTGKGTGLGLATVYSIVEQHGGHLEVSSEVGAGTSFVIYLPRTEPQPARPILPRPARERLTGTETILVVEDEENVRALVQQILSHAGYRVFVAGDALAALRIWTDRGPDIALLLTDIAIPGEQNGLALAQQLLRERPALKVIYMTGYSQGDSRQPLLRAFLGKPFEPAQLLAAVRAILHPAGP